MLDIALEAAKLVKTMTVEAFYSAGNLTINPIAR